MCCDGEGNVKFIIYPILIMVIIHPFIGDYFFEKRARQLALDDKNIIRGCLFLEKKYRHRNSSDFLLYDVNVDGKVYSTLDISISGFPYYAKQFDFERKMDVNISCYKIEYVKVGYWFFERRYIYDFS